MFLIFASGAVFFPGLFFGLKKILKSTFRNWNEADVVVVSERLVSTVHASLATTAGAVIVTSCRNVMTDTHWLANGFVFFGVNYMAFDIYAMYLSHYHTQRVRGHDAYKGHSLRTVQDFLFKDCLLVLHHLVLILIFMPVTLLFRRGLGDFFVGCMFITEFSTPFLSTAMIFIQLGLQDSLLHWLNSFLLLLSFFTCRILIFPFMYLMYGRQQHLPLHALPLRIPLHCHLANLLILSLQLHWFARLCAKAWRLYRRQRGRAAAGPRPKEE